MYSALSHAHSGLRWVVLFLLVFAIFNAFTRKTVYEKKDKMIYLFSMVFLHIQLLIGLALYFISDKVSFASGWMKEPLYRFYGMEHFLGMVIAIVLVTIGRKKAEKASEPVKKHKIIRVYYVIGLIIVLASIPWPFREALVGKWF
ncbi:MAG: hypothetical protein QNK75_10950 [Crocinitomicaceae bacterium]|jgi:hypothetical protein